MMAASCGTAQSRALIQNTTYEVDTARWRLTLKGGGLTKKRRLPKAMRDQGVVPRGDPRTRASAPHISAGARKGKNMRHGDGQRAPWWLISGPGGRAWIWARAGRAGSA